MAKLSLKAIGILLKKMVFLNNHKYVSKSELSQKPRFEGEVLVFD